ncbi:winged helix-turn-helix domain-containing protein [Clostridioides difficile]|uniref:winged helix-turn-helix domain-containing protein n=1 Tax=Clostridioides difficile TaxID=1496 RepID=UPI000BB17E44|nr:winged helix-turn-helix domain-containing protein [Clostridioides difficile]EGT5507153.1 winged helix family transcriptional regulator [Clostridioides difficile]EGT5548473.1 winged helix family transcriptional regulator [Clostridioides difficile]EGT5552529.1 winged helix family transcriptional regulator [Clostridioides difficile]MBG0083073.1 winged helix-turn-helix transcriptional regulator [Clostridioides difficile]MBG0145627.1 winged helix-turn-helix transcriptional regulator [Clostridioi
MLIAEFAENEEVVFRQTIEWLTSKLANTPTLIRKQVSGFNIDTFTRTFTNYKGENVYLTAKEFDLLYFFICHKGQVFTKEQLYRNVWGYDNAPLGSNLTSFIRKLRKKIEPSPDSPQYILTVWGVGYKFNEKKL